MTRDQKPITIPAQVGDESDHDLYVRWTRDGDKAAGNAILARYHDPFYRWAIHRWDDEPLAKDVCQFAWMKALQLGRHRGEGQNGSYRGEGRFLEWIKRLANTEHARVMRAAKRRAELSLFPADLPASVASPTYVLLKFEVMELIELFENPEQRETARLYYGEGLEVADIADMMGAKASTVRSRLRLVQEKLTQAIRTPKPRRRLS